MNLGGENVLQSVLSKTTFAGLRNWGWSGRCLFLLREMTENRQKRGGGETYRGWGGPKTFLGRGFSPNLRYVFHPPEFSTPLGRSLTFVLCNGRVRNWKINCQIIFCAIRVHRKYHLEVPELHNIVLARKPCVTRAELKVTDLR